MAPSERARRRGGKQREQLWCPLPVRHLSYLPVSWPTGEAAHTQLVAPAASQEPFLGICVYMLWCHSIYKQLWRPPPASFDALFFLSKGNFFLRWTLRLIRGAVVVSAAAFYS